MAPTHAQETGWQPVPNMPTTDKSARGKLFVALFLYPRYVHGRRALREATNQELY